MSFKKSIGVTAQRYGKSALTVAASLAPLVVNAQVQDLGGMGDLVSGQTSAIAKAVYYVFLVAGVGLVGYGLVNVMMAGQRQQPTGGFWMMVLIGSALASLTAIIGVMSGTLLGSGQTGISNIGL
jgi:hypothetical protein